jgi:hypothetical protein
MYSAADDLTVERPPALPRNILGAPPVFIRHTIHQNVVVEVQVISLQRDHLQFQET